MTVPADSEVEPFPWFAIWTRSRHEQVVREQLQQKRIDVFLPTIAKWSRWKDRKKKIDWPLFPGYCFARFDARDRLPILKCTGVVSIVSVDGEPAPIPEHQIEGIKLLIESDLAFNPCRMLREERRAKAVKGRLRTVIGERVGRKKKVGRFLRFDLTEQGVSAEVDAADVKPY